MTITHLLHLWHVWIICDKNHIKPMTSQIYLSIYVYYLVVTAYCCHYKSSFFIHFCLFDVYPFKRKPNIKNVRVFFCLYPPPYIRLISFIFLLFQLCPFLSWAFYCFFLSWLLYLKTKLKKKITLFLFIFFHYSRRILIIVDNEMTKDLRKIVEIFIKTK